MEQHVKQERFSFHSNALAAGEKKIKDRKRIQEFWFVCLHLAYFVRRKALKLSIYNVLVRNNLKLASVKFYRSSSTDNFMLSPPQICYLNLVIA